MKKNLLLLSFWILLYSGLYGQNIFTIAGNGTAGNSGDGGPAISALVSSPYGVATDKAGNIYFCDSYNYRIRKIDVSGTITTVAGSGYAGFRGDGGLATLARLQLPVAIALDNIGNIYIVVGDTATNRIRKVSASGIITTIAGTGIAGFSGDGGLATAANINPYGIAVDTTGNIYISDYGNGRIRKISVSGIITTIAGNGTNGFSGDGGAAIDAQLHNPVGVTIDNDGNIYFADAGNNNIRKISTLGIITTIAGNDTLGFSGDGGRAINAKLNNPTRISSDNIGNIYIVDATNNRIRKISTAGIITTVAGNGGKIYSGDGGIATSASFFLPSGVAVDASGNIFITDVGNRIREVVSARPSLTSFTPVRGITGTSVTISGSYFASTSSVTFGGTAASSFIVSNDSTITAIIGSGATGNIKVTNSVGYDTSKTGFTYFSIIDPTVTSFTPGTGTFGTIVTISGTHFMGTSSVTFGKTAALSYTVLNDSTITAVVGSGATGNIKVTNAASADTSKTSFTYTITVVAPTITSFTPAIGSFETSVIISGFHFTGTSSVTFGGIAASDYTISSDSTITALVGPGATGSIKVTNPVTADSSKTSFTYISGPVITTIAGNGVTGFSGDGGPATSALLYNPEGVTVDKAGNIYFADNYNYRIRKIATTGIITTIAGTGRAGFSGDGGLATSAQLQKPQGIAIDDAGNIYFGVGDTCNRIRKVSTSGIITTVAGNGIFGFTGDGGLAIAARVSIDAFTVDNAGNIYCVDTRNSVIRKIALSGIITTMAGNGSNGTSGDGGLATSAQFSLPWGVAVDKVGNIYISDAGNNRIRKVATSGIISTICGKGLYGFSGDGGAATSAQLNFPRSITVDTSGNIYFIDLNNVRIRKIATSGIITTVAGNGSDSYHSFNGDGGQAISAAFSSPSGLAVNNSGNIFVADRGNQEIRVVSAIKPSITSFSPASGMAGTSVTIVGAHFTGTSIVTFGGTAASSYTVSNDSTIKAIVGSGATGVIKVTNAASSDTSKTWFTYAVVAPTIKSFTPVSGTTGTSVIISGSHFTGTSSVTFGGTAASSYTVSNDSMITAIVAAGSTGNIKVTNTASSDTSKTWFTYAIVAPTIKSFTPFSGTVGTSVTIVGTHFTGTSLVTFGGAAASSFTVSTDSTITAIVGPGATGAIKVTNSTSSDTSKTRFTYIAVVAPIIKSFTPANGTTGTSVIISGSHFTGTSSVKFGGIAVSSYTVSNDSTITAIVGTGATGFIEVVNNYLGDTSLISFTYISKSIPSINIIASLVSFKTCSGTVSPTQNFTVSGSKLTSPITIITSNNLEISSNLDNSYGAVVNLSPVTDTIGGTTIYVRLKANSAAGIYDDTITIFSPGVNVPKNIWLRDTVNALPITPTIVNYGAVTFCNGGNVLLTDSLSTGNQWFINDSAINGANSISYSATVSGNFTVKTKNANGCNSAVSKVTTVKVNPTPVSNFNIPSACSGRAVYFIDSTTLSDGTQNSNVFNWNFGDGSTSPLKNPIHNYSSSANYKVTLTVISINGCKDSVTRQVIINPQPRANFTASTIACSNVPVSFSDSGSANGSVIKNWKWSFGDSLNNTNNTSQNTVHGYSYPGNYAVILFVTSDKGCTDSTVQTIVINATPAIPVVSPIITYCKGMLADTLKSVVVNGNSLLWYNQATGGNGSTVSPVPATSSIGKTDFYVSQKNYTTSCESQRANITVNVNPYPVVPSITSTLNQLISSPSTYYKWYYYDSLIDNGTNDRINLLTKGLYMVTTSLDNICWSSSIEYLVQSNPSSTTQKDYQLTVYPNPASGQFYMDIKLDAEYSGNMKFSMVSLSGTTSIVYQKYIFNSQRIKIPISFNLGNQVYILTVTINGYLTKTIKITGI